MAPPAVVASDAELIEFRIAEEVDRLRVTREARRRLDAEALGTPDPPEITTLRDRLSRPQPAVRWSIKGWQPRHGRVMMAAQFKAGKTTTVGNYIRCKVDGDAWLGLFDVTRTRGTLVLLDFEMAPAQLDEWLRAQRIRNDDRVLVIPMRGRASTFNPLDQANRAEWAALFRGYAASDLVLDCLRPPLDALGLDEHKDAGRFLVHLDELLKESSIDEALVVQHMGHQAERARGDSRLRDWPDVEWRVVRQDDTPSSPRFISAYGRDVDQPEMQLAYDGFTRRLTVAGGTRQDAKSKAALDAILDVLASTSMPMSGRAIKAALVESEYPRDVVDAALKSGVALKVLAVELGPRNARLYSQLSERPAVSGDCPADGASECPAAYIKPDTRTLAFDDESMRPVRTLEPGATA